MNDPQYHGLYYDMGLVSEKAGIPGGYVMGAGAGAKPYCGSNAELMPTLCTGAGGDNTSRYAVVGPEGEMVLKPYHDDRVAILANLLVSDGLPCDVIEVRVKIRKGEKNFVTAMREGLAEQVGDSHLGLAGVFTVVNGKCKAHVMPDFKTTVMVDGPEVMEWLKFYEVDPGMTLMSVLLTGDPTGGSLNLRLEHTHFFNDKLGQGGHYHYDVTPDDVEYFGYFAPADAIYRISNAYKHVEKMNKL